MNPHNSFTFFTEKETAEAFIHFIKGIIQHIVIGDNLIPQLPSYNLNKILNCSSIVKLLKHFNI
jgi:hypothetical protein